MDANKFQFVVPARMAASRFPGKVLKQLGDKAVVDWVYDNCLLSKYCGHATIATDADEVMQHGKNTGRNVVWTKQHDCCSDRTAEVAAKLDSEWIVEVQGDEPFLWASIMDTWLSQAVAQLKDAKDIDVFISVAPLPQSLSANPNFVKIITNPTAKLLWASRSKIPSDFKGKGSEFIRHTGFYMWRRTSLVRFASIAPGPVERSEDTHALRLVENDFHARAIMLPETQSIDIPADLVAAQDYLEKNRDLVMRETQPR